MISIIASSAPGLSPLARGTLQNKTVLIAFCRFIPAGAGNTKWQFWPLLIMAVYPRWRGEHGRVPEILNRSHGLSPLARGTLNLNVFQSIFLRFIPAGAGNTLSSHESRYPYSVYPRWRGEHVHHCLVDIHNAGLSPLARGTH